MFDACDRRPWMRGFMLWDWPPPRLYPLSEAAANDDYCPPYGKPAAAFLRDTYLAKTR